MHACDGLRYSPILDIHENNNRKKIFCRGSWTICENWHARKYSKVLYGTNVCSACTCVYNVCCCNAVSSYWVPVFTSPVQAVFNYEKAADFYKGEDSPGWAISVTHATSLSLPSSPPPPSLSSLTGVISSRSAAQLTSVWRRWHWCLLSCSTSTRLQSFLKRCTVDHWSIDFAYYNTTYYHVHM